MLRELGHKVTGRGSRPSSGSRDERSRSRDEKSPARGLITDPNIVKQSKGGGAASSSGKRLHQPIALNIADMLDAFEVSRHCMSTCLCVCWGGWVGFKLLKESAYTSPSLSISQTCWTLLR